MLRRGRQSGLEIVVRSCLGFVVELGLLLGLLLGLRLGYGIDEHDQLCGSDSVDRRTREGFFSGVLVGAQ